MSDFQKVDHPAIWPQKCVCGATAGPLVDTTWVNSAGERVYLCSSCVRLAARCLGFVKGERMTELLKAGALLDEAKKEAEQREGIMAEQLNELAARGRKIEALEELLQQARDAESTRRKLIEQTNELTGQLLRV